MWTDKQLFSLFWDRQTGTCHRDARSMTNHEATNPWHQREVLSSSCFLVPAPHHVPLISCKEGAAFLPFVAVNCYTHAMEGLKKATALKQLEPCKVLSAADLSPSSSSHSLLSWADWSSSAKHHASAWWEAGNVTTRREMTASRPACATTSY